MNYKNVNFHNVAELDVLENGDGVVLQRYPKEVRKAFKGASSYVSRETSGCEIRFVSTAREHWLTLSAIDRDCDITVYLGDFIYQTHSLKAGIKTTIKLTWHYYFDEIPLDFFEEKRKRFSSRLWRVCLAHSAVIFHGIEGLDGEVSLPPPEHMPKLKWLAYGSSITHGSWSLNPQNSYIQHAARLLYVDVLNKGLSGSCLCEKEAADYFANSNDWDFATFEIGVNMKTRFSDEAFFERAEYLINTVCEKNPDKKVFIITIFPNIGTYTQKDLPHGIREVEFNNSLRKIAENSQHKNLHLIEGYNILDDYSYLCYDMIHPSDYGHINMGQNLAGILKEYLY